ncbi:MAG: aldolase/citrate lyase family protein [Prevotella sp.]|uniref:aldolase/citrate lyase family protein n=1 Tax=Prevotella sp. TaxID=59823 RepID=UPI002A2B7F68|nr:aldolase/citrate lyase family protein [Prevotella sp.]MDD7317454.1 aldolase/citrate lyase family protein [Prevotellaceae bacterium]MDY4019210.1 aldolase/citrate lyase family protein [Prevotella sp.]
MALTLMYITNSPEVATIADRNGVDRIFIDLETRGKEQRQGHIDSVKSHHALQDIDKVKERLGRSQLLVRCNPLYDGSREEIAEIISRGADIVMLPMWRTSDEAFRFIEYVRGKARVMLLLETRDAEKIIGEVVDEGGVDEVYVGLNDLHLDYGQTFLFEPLANGTIDSIAERLNSRNMFFGFGGIAALDGGLISGRNIITEHYRLHSQMAILSRAFCDTSKTENFEQVEKTFADGVRDIRRFETELAEKPKEYFEDNHRVVCEKVAEIVKMKKARQ